MTRNHRIYRVAATVVICLIVVSLETSTGRDRSKGMEVEAQVYSVPVTQTDAARAINAYERLMERQMDLTEQNLMNLAADLKVLAAKFDTLSAKIETVDARMTQIDQRLDRIEKHLGIVPAPPKTPAPLDPNAPATLKVPTNDLPAAWR